MGNEYMNEKNSIIPPPEEKSEPQSSCSVVALLGLCQVLSEIGMLVPYLEEFEKLKESSRSNSLFVWFLLYNFAGAGLGEAYGHSRIISVGFILAAVWALAEYYAGQDEDLYLQTLSSVLRTFGPSLVFSPSKNAINRLQPERYQNRYSIFLYAAGLVGAILFNKVAEYKIVYAAYAVLSIIVVILVGAIFPNKPRPGMSTKWFLNIPGALGLVASHLLWERLTSTVEWSVLSVSQVVAIIAGAAASLWMSLQ